MLLDHKLYEVIPTTTEQIKLLQFLEDETEIDIWNITSKPKGSLNVMVPSFLQEEFEKTLKELDLYFKLTINNTQSIVSEEKDYNASAPSLDEGIISFKKYHRYAEIQDYMKYLSEEYSTLVLLDHYGTSYEHRNLSYIRISTGGNYHKPIIFIDAGVHAREWISPAQALYLLHQLIEISENRYLINNVDWIIIPLANPDGYEYSHTKNRFWRKTRSRVRRHKTGVDINRNFDFHWMEKGASQDAKSPVFAGRRPFSEPETRALSQLILKNSSHIKLYLSIHSAKQCIIYPFGFTSKLPDNFMELHTLATNVGKAISHVNGNHYEIGNSEAVLTKSAGSSRDWVYGVAGVDLSYTLELPGGGKRGFDLPAGKILSVVKEIFEGIKVFHKYIEDEYSD